MSAAETVARSTYLAALLRMHGTLQLPVRKSEGGRRKAEERALPFRLPPSVFRLPGRPRILLQAMLQPLRLRQDPLVAGDERAFDRRR